MTIDIDHTYTTDSTDHTVIIADGSIRIERIQIRDPAVAGVLSRLDPVDRADAIRRMLGIGARAMIETAVGVDLAAVDERVTRTIERVTEAAEERVRRVVAEAEQTMRASLDPDTRTSALARAIAEFEAVRISIVSAVDPTRTDSHIGVLLAAVTRLLGPGGDLEARLHAALDPSGETSALGSLHREMERHFADLRDVLAEQRGRRDEARIGTRKGFAFEDLVEDRLRDLARPLGAIVERTADRVGDVGDDLVGDFVVTLPNGASIVVEAKNTARIVLNGTSGILVELDRAIANRNASIAICVSAEDAYPAEVGSFGVYSNRILVVDDGEGTMLAIAVRWATLLSTAQRDQGAVDAETLAALTDRVRRMAQLFSTHRRSLTDAIDSIDKVRSGLDDMRRDLLAHLDEMDFELERKPGAIELRVVGSD
jgi:predicted  nucleic acid-binding Zn-ribbon protein